MGQEGRRQSTEGNMDNFDFFGSEKLINMDKFTDQKATCALFSLLWRDFVARQAQ